MTEIKAIIMDGDGSTITQDNQLPNSLRNLILNNPHILWIMATGRSLDLLMDLPICQYLSDVPHIVDGGARLVTIGGINVSSHFLSKLEINSLFKQLRHIDIEFIYYYLEPKLSFLYTQKLDQFVKHPQLSKACQVLSLDNYHQLCLKYPPTKLYLKTKTHLNLENLTWYQNEYNIDITPSGITKGSGCIELLSLLKLKPHEVGFVFNDKNDVPLVTHPKLTNITTIKVGNYLPNVSANYSVANPHMVADVIANLIL